MASTYMISGDEEKKPSIPTPAAGPRPGQGPMKKTEFQSLVSGLITSAAQYVDSELSPKRALAAKYYKGEPFGNEEPGRSQFVVTEVRDGILDVLPSMLRVVFGPERVVEFRPREAEDVDGAEQKTDYINYIFSEDNPGFLHSHACIKDGLLKMTGIFKWWWDDTTATTSHKVENVDQEGLEILASDEEVKLTRVEPTSTTPGPDGQPVQLFTAEFTHTQKNGIARFEPVPPEELLVNRDARAFGTAIGLWHRTRKTRGELVAMGITEKDIDAHGGDDPGLKDSEEEIARQVVAGSNDEADAGEANEMHVYYEGFARVDYDGDSKAELRKVCAIGPAQYVVSNEPTDDINMCMWGPDPEPHALIGQSYADRLMDMQRYKSMVFRGLSDSLAASIFPRTWYKEGDANLADILNVQVGAPIRTKSGPNAVGEFAHSFLGKEAMPVLDMCDDIVERRTGRNKGVAGLDADALQSSTPAAVTAAVTASQGQQEMLVRLFAEGALKPLFKGLLKLVVEHQPRVRTVRLRNKWVSVDPRTWDADMDVSVNVALGSGLVEQKVETLMAISDKQSEILQQLGPQNPICGMKQYRDTLAEIAELRGKKDSSRYFKVITEEDEKKAADDAANTPPPKSPEQQIAEAQIQIEQQKAEAANQREIEKTKREFAMKQAELAMKLKEMQLEDERERMKQAAEDDRERDKQAADIEMKIRELELKHMVDLKEQEINADIEMTRASSQSGPGEGAAPPKNRKVTIDRHPETGAMTGWQEKSE